MGYKNIEQANKSLHIYKQYCISIMPLSKMKIKTIILVSLTMLSCTNSGKFEQSETIDIYGDTVGRLPIDSNMKLDTSTIAKWLIDNYLLGRKLHVDLAKTLKDMSIFKIRVKGEVATSVRRDYTFITIRNKNSYLLPVEFNQFININDKMMFGGIYNYREFDYYFIYEIIGEKLKRTFDSRKVKTGVKIGYYRDDECVEYYPKRLVFDNEKKTSIFFRGIVKNFCRKGQDRMIQQKQPLTKEEISIRIDYNGEFWVYNDSSKYKFW